MKRPGAKTVRAKAPAGVMKRPSKHMSHAEVDREMETLHAALSRVRSPIPKGAFTSRAYDKARHMIAHIVDKEAAITYAQAHYKRASKMHDDLKLHK